MGEDVFESGAKVYTARCAACHGTPAHDGSLATSTSPPALQLWRKRATGTAVGDSALEPGEIYSKTRYGIPHTGMPAYKAQLSDTQIWQIALLLKSANQPLPDPVRALLTSGR
nr:cytochrome c [Granulicella tundricola]